MLVKMYFSKVDLRNKLPFSQLAILHSKSKSKKAFLFFVTMSWASAVKGKYSSPILVHGLW